MTAGLEDDTVFIGARCIEPLVSQGGVRFLQLPAMSSALMCQMFRCSQDTKGGSSETCIFMLAERSQLLVRSMCADVV